MTRNAQGIDALSKKVAVLERKQLLMRRRFDGMAARLLPVPAAHSNIDNPGNTIHDPELEPGLFSVYDGLIPILVYGKKINLLDFTQASRLINFEFLSALNSSIIFAEILLLIPHPENSNYNNYEILEIYHPGRNKDFNPPSFIQRLKDSREIKMLLKATKKLSKLLVDLRVEEVKSATRVNLEKQQPLIGSSEQHSRIISDSVHGNTAAKLQIAIIQLSVALELH